MLLNLHLVHLKVNVGRKPKPPLMIANQVLLMYFVNPFLGKGKRCDLSKKYYIIQRHYYEYKLRSDMYD